MSIKKGKIQEEAISAHIKLGKRSIIGLSVGMGKTKVVIDRVQFLRAENPQLKVLFTGARQSYISSFKKELVKWKCDSSNIVMICNKSILNYIYHYDIVIYDEAHKESKLVLHYLRKLVEINPKLEIIGLTGTPLPKGSDIYSLLPISYTYLIEDAIDEKNLNNFGITIIRHSLTPQENAMYSYLFNKYRLCTSNSSYSPNLSKLKVFLNNLGSKVNVAEKLLTDNFKDEKVIIYAGSIEQGGNLKFPQYNSKIAKIKKEENYNNFYNSTSEKLVNVGMLKESVSIPHLKYGMVLGIESSPSSKEQIIGRFCRLAVEEKSHIYFLVAKNH
jgi:superfamily II DNA or RNA helicase